MRRSVRILCRPEWATGFALAGLAPIEAAGPEAGARALRALVAAPDAGVVLVDEAIYAALPEETQREIGRRPLPMVVPFPGPLWAGRAEGAEAFIVEILRQAIGYRVRLR